MKDEQKQLENILHGNFFNKIKEDHENLLEEEKERMDKLNKMKEMFTFLENNNPFT